MMQFDNSTSVANTFAQFNCRGNENAYVLGQDEIASKNMSANAGGYGGGGLIGGMIAGAINEAARNKNQEQEMIPGCMFIMLDVTEAGIGVLAIKKAGLFKKWDTASVMDNTSLFFMRYEDMEFVELKKSMGGYLLSFKTKTGVTFRARIMGKAKELDYHDAGLQAIIARFGLK